jgi:hypothetical protein
MIKISETLDKVADALEAQGYIKEAYRIDKIADLLSQISGISGLNNIPNMILRDAIKNHIGVIDQLIANARGSTGQKDPNAMNKIVTLLRICDQKVTAILTSPTAPGTPPTTPGVPPVVKG